MYKPVRCKAVPGYRKLSQADFRLLEILQSESRRWETVVGVLLENEWPTFKLDTPQLRTLECSWLGLHKFNASNLRRLHILSESGGITTSPIPTYKNLRHLHLQYASPNIVRSISVIFPFLETIIVANVFSGHDDAGSHLVTHSCLESLTLPLPSDLNYSHWFTEIFVGLHLPVLRKLTLVGCPTKSGVDRIMAWLEVTATCNLQVIDFQTAMPQDEVDVDVVEPLLSVVREISVCYSDVVPRTISCAHLACPTTLKQHGHLLRSATRKKKRQKEETEKLSSHDTGPTQRDAEQEISTGKKRRKIARGRCIL
ncbi:uncharacterized protein BJ212DRAFT_572880 [Suillus subaureus]|uniref:F-box domain-containing protein n=1 Tax=Suillus subaureus TaxID=48587 RepID=A0A9P7E4C8_9AGAM|nr:uncharacterized protein BJ212DRAFT_572880 [Suillus subaureus]KAG1810880.1 hypothetical protein BJ212DRAFT_572880 [Suillus subaureus]